MSQDRHWKNPSAAKRHESRQTKALIARNNELERLTSAVFDAVNRNTNGPVIFADSYESLLLILALDLPYGPDVKTVNRHSQAHVTHCGRQKTNPGDRQTLISDAVQLAVSRKRLRFWRDTASSRVALYYLPIESSPKWRVFFAEAGVVDDYIPSRRELELESVAERDFASNGIALTDRDRAQLRKWGVEEAA